MPGYQKGFRLEGPLDLGPWYRLATGYQRENRGIGVQKSCRKKVIYCNVLARLHLRPVPGFMNLTVLRTAGYRRYRFKLDTFGKTSLLQDL